MGQNFHEFRECEAIREILPSRNSIFQNTAKISDVIVGSRINAICVDTLSGTAAVSSMFGWFFVHVQRLHYSFSVLEEIAICLFIRLLKASLNYVSVHVFQTQ